MKKLLSITALFVFTIAFLGCDNANANQGSMVGALNDTDKNKEKISIVEAYKIGEKVEDFSLKNVNGNMVSMADYTDADGFIIIFTCNTCPYSQMYEERIIALDKKYSTQGWPVIAINPNDPEAQEGEDFASMQQRAKDKGYTFPYLVDEGQKVYPKFGAARTPHVFIVNKTEAGSILEYAGAIDDNARDANAVEDNYIDNVIEAIQAGETPEPRMTRAIGCTIKTK